MKLNVLIKILKPENERKRERYSFFKYEFLKIINGVIDATTILAIKRLKSLKIIIQDSILPSYFYRTTWKGGRER